MKISKIAIKKPSGKVVSAPIGKHHQDIPATGKRGFILSDGTFVGRSEATKVARKSGQTETKRPLHSHLLKK